MSDEIKAAEQRGYSRGYVAGRKRVKQERIADNLRKEHQAFLEKAFLAALPFAFTQTTWTIGKEPINTTEQRVDFAWRIAKQSLKTRPMP